MSKPRRPAARPGYPDSPCVDICRLDEGGVCIGCRRTLPEIAAWSGMTAEQQRQVLRALPARGGAGPGDPASVPAVDSLLQWRRDQKPF